MLSVINKVNKKLIDNLTEFEDLNFTSVSTRTPDVFPTLSVVSLGEPTAVSDLTQTVQAAIYSTVELKAYSNKTLNEATKILDKAGDIMMENGYLLVAGQLIISDVKPFCKVARFRRIFGEVDAKMF